MIAALFLSSSAYLIPILIATGATDIPQSDWKVGTFAVAGSQIAGEWLGSWIVVSAAICTVAAYCSEINAGEHVIRIPMRTGSLNNSYNKPCFKHVVF